MLDAAVIGQLREMAAMGRADFVRRITDLYLEHAPKALSEAAAAQRAGDVKALASAVHALKSMSLNAGAKQVSALAARIEEQARQHGECAASEDIEALGRALEQACAGLAELAVAA